MISDQDDAAIPCGETGLYHLCGFIVRSELALPELRPLASALPPGTEPDLDIRFGSVPPHLEGADHVRRWFETRGTDEILIRPQAIGRFLLTAPGTIRIDPVLPIVEKDLRAILFGSVLGAFIHMRGLLPLHASAVTFGDGVVAFAGVSGAGKSTMAAFLSDRGHQTVADDVCVVDTGGAAPMVRPAIARLKLWGASMDALGKPRLEANRDTLRWEKYHVRQEPEVSARPLRAVVALEQAAGPHPELKPLAGAEAITNVLQNTFRPEIARHLGRTPQIFRLSAATAAAVPVYRLDRTWDLDRIEPIVDLLEATWGPA
ncbi:hypothetical protein AB7M35_004320 [Amorphus suaedae]